MGTKLNLNFYKDKDFYSDGDIEDEILNIVKSQSNFRKRIFQ